MSSFSAAFDRFYLWATRCIPGLLTVGFLVLTYSALVDSKRLAFHAFEYHRYPSNWPPPSQLLFIGYGIFLHLITFAFPVRLIFAARSITAQIIDEQAENATRTAAAEARALEDEKAPKETQVSFDMMKTEHPAPEVIHAIMVPSYKEDVSTLDDTLKVLASHANAARQYHVVLAMEARDPGAEKNAAILIERFTPCFRKVEHTLHPSDIPGEAAGKSSNVSWAAKHVQRTYTGTFAYKNVLLTVMDCDTHLLSAYFEKVTLLHSTKRGAPTLYCPPCIFDRNANMVPAMVRMADLLWGGALLSMFSKSAKIVIPTAVYTLPLPVVVRAGGWDTGPEAIGEDMHMALKTYFATEGSMGFEIIACPASQCNVGGDARGIRGFFNAHDARYKQGLRHMWGSMDTGFAFRRWCSLGCNPPAASSPSTRPRKASETEIDFRLSQMDVPSPRRLRLTTKNMILFTRMFEAHLLPANLVVCLVASTLYQALVPAAQRTPLMEFFLAFTNLLRTISYFVMIFFFAVYYERFHATCIGLREQAMKKAGLYDQLQDQFAYRSQRRVQTWIDYIIFPVAGMLFGSIAAMQATVSHFFTDRLVYVVSQKPLLERMANKLEAAVAA